MEPHPYKDLPHLSRCSEWVIVFAPYRGRSRLKKWLLAKRFGHVWAFTEVHGSTLMFDPFNGGYFSAVTKLDPHLTESGMGITPVILASAILREEGMTLLRYKARLPQTKPHVSNCIPSCVTMLKLLVGVRAWAMTPRQLYKHLLKNGAEPLNAITLPALLEADKIKRAERLK